jgi:hypothetical protein
MALQPSCRLAPQAATAGPAGTGVAGQIESPITGVVNLGVASPRTSSRARTWECGDCLPGR